MSLTSGFYNSMNGDRKYSAEQMSAIFDGVITDGIFANIGDCFRVRAGSGNAIVVGTGKAWFNSKWILNNCDYRIEMPLSDDISDRIDAVIIEVNLNDNVREAGISIEKGIPSVNPEKPELATSDCVYKYVIAYVLRKAGSTEVTQNNITNVVGTGERPYVADLLEPNRALYIYDNIEEDIDLDDFYEKIKSYHKPIRFTLTNKNGFSIRGTQGQEYGKVPFDLFYPYDKPVASYDNDSSIFTINEDGIYRIVLTLNIYTDVENRVLFGIQVDFGTTPKYADCTIDILGIKSSKTLHINTIRAFKKGEQFAIVGTAGSDHILVNGGSNTFGYVEKIGEKGW